VVVVVGAAEVVVKIVCVYTGICHGVGGGQGRWSHSSI